MITTTETWEFIKNQNYVPTLLIFSITILFLILSLISGFVLYEKTQLFKKSYRTNFILDKNLYKVPLRWILLGILRVHSMWNKKSELYYKEATKGEFDYFDFNKEFLLTVANENSYRYSLLIVNLVNYMQKVRYELESRKNKPIGYKGLMGTLRLHRDAYQMKSMDNSEGRQKTFHRARYDLSKSLPPNIKLIFITEEPFRVIKRANDAEKRHIELLRSNFDDLKIETRSVTKRQGSGF